jgi:hypothetical protein
MIKYFAANTNLGPPCRGGNFLSLPTWYKYLPSEPGSNPCAAKIHSITDVWLIAAAVIEILLRVAALAAIAMIIYAGIQYITSEGQPDKAASALKTIINAAIGLVLVVSAAALVSFVAGRFN